MSGVRYRVHHETRYLHAAPVSQSWQLARLTPCSLPWQQRHDCRIDIDPEPGERHDAVDSFGNTVTHFAVLRPHRRLAVQMKCDVSVGPRPPPDAGASLSWEAVRDAVRMQRPGADLMPARLCEPSRLLPWSEAARAYAAPSLGRGRAWLDALQDLMSRIHREFSFDPGATTVSSSVEEVLAERGGVCQDFAHLMIAGLRAHGLPARYMSGYLLTDPPPGSPRLAGVDASHAWVAAHAPGVGWVEFDPTNDQLADTRYITLGWGADFADIGPLRGVILGSGRHALEVSVTVTPT